MVMHTLSASDLLRVWEAGQSLSPPQRALTLLAAADPEASVESLARLPLGARDARLIDVRAQCFGGALTALAACPNCGGRVEFEFDTRALRAPSVRADDVFAVAVGGAELSIRALNTLDVLAVGGEPGADPRRALAERCVTGGARGLTDAQVDAISGALREVDPQAEVSIALTCPVCGCAWSAILDIASYVWQEIDAWAQRALDDVHALAAAYHWREDDILAMSAWRRQQYLQRISP